jgi:predicted DNA-binding protein
MKLDKATTVRLFEGSDKQLEEIAESKGLKKADILRIAVKFYLNYINTTTEQ